MPMILPSQLASSSSPQTPPVNHHLASPNLHDAAGQNTSPLPSPFLSAFSPNSPLLKAASRSRTRRPSSSSAHKSTPPLVPTIVPLALSFRLESPPLVLYGKSTESTGALLSGLFTLEVLENEPFPMKTVYMAIVQEVRTIRPHSGHCKDCLSHTTELARWDVLKHPADLPKQRHVYPFSHLIPGSVPATTKNSVFSVSYHLTAVAVPDNTRHKITDATGNIINFPKFAIKYPLNIKRSIVRGADRNSVRVFPPTDIVAQITLPSAVFPDSSFPFELVVEGVSVNKDNTEHRKTRWTMRKINWRIDEESRIKAYRCPAHLHVPLDKHLSPPRSRSESRNPSRANRSPFVPPSEASASPSGSPTLPPTPAAAAAAAGSEEFFLEDIRTLGAGELKSGWKPDFDGKGKIEFLTEFLTLKSSCDIDDPTFGLKTTHTLVVEMVVAEEAVTTKTKQVMPTGAARVLRMQFLLNMTERSGLGIAWDDEVPPTYADVPLSPPEYQNVAQLPAFENVRLEADEEYSEGIHARLNGVTIE